MPRAIRIPDDLWAEAREQTAARGTTISEVVRDGLRAWLDAPCDQTTKPPHPG